MNIPKDLLEYQDIHRVKIKHDYYHNHHNPHHKGSSSSSSSSLLLHNKRKIYTQYSYHHYHNQHQNHQNHHNKYYPHSHSHHRYQHQYYNNTHNGDELINSNNRYNNTKLKDTNTITTKSKQGYYENEYVKLNDEYHHHDHHGHHENNLNLNTFTHEKYIIANLSSCSTLPSEEELNNNSIIMAGFKIIHNGKILQNQIVFESYDHNNSIIASIPTHTVMKTHTAITHNTTNNAKAYTTTKFAASIYNIGPNCKNIPMPDLINDDDDNDNDEKDNDNGNNDNNDNTNGDNDNDVDVNNNEDNDDEDNMGRYNYESTSNTSSPNSNNSSNSMNNDNNGYPYTCTWSNNGLLLLL